MFAEEDTAFRQGHVILIRKADDTLFQGWIYIEFDSLWLGYNGEHLMRAFPLKSSITFADPVIYSGAFIASTAYNDFVDYSFLRKGAGAKEFLTDPSSRVVFGDTMINGHSCLGAMVYLPDDPRGFIRQRYYMAFDPGTNVPVRKMFSSFFQDNEQYTEWTYTDVQYDKTSVIEAFEQEHLSGYQLRSTFEWDTLSDPADHPFSFNMLEGTILGTGDSMFLAQTKAKMTVLDFWYTACYPCIRSIPLVNTLYVKYNDRGVQVYGINMIDDESKSRDRLKKFMRNNPMAYKTLMIDKRYNALIPLEGYPTLLILDENLQVIYSETGFNENMVEEVSTFLDSRL